MKGQKVESFDGWLMGRLWSTTDTWRKIVIELFLYDIHPFIFKVIFTGRPFKSLIFFICVEKELTFLYDNNGSAYILDYLFWSIQPQKSTALVQPLHFWRGKAALFLYSNISNPTFRVSFAPCTVRNAQSHAPKFRLSKRW